MATGMFGWIEDHPDIALGGGVVAVLLIAGSMFKAKTPTAGAAQDLSGLTNGIVYVPTQTSFTTENQSGIFASNDPLLQTVSNTGFNTTDTTTTTTTTNPQTPCPPGWSRAADGRCIPITHPRPPTRNPPPPGPKPPPTGGKSLKWTSTHTVAGGETLTSIAASQNRYNKARNGMPEQYNIRWTDLWQHNQGIITKYANMHGHYRNVQDWIFPGETLSVPVWV